MNASNSHVVAFSVLQVIILVLFLLFVRYDPKLAQKGERSGRDGDKQIKDIYPMFQDVHVMIFAGIGFLMTFLKKYGLSAVSLNMICAALTIEVYTLVYGFLHPQCGDPHYMFGKENCESSWPYIDVSVGSMISADFATATVLISFGVVLGVTSPLQLVVMTVMETIFYALNDMIGRDYLHAVDVGCTIFIHLFAAYFGLTVSRVLHQEGQANSSKEGTSYTSDMFSMVGTVFLWIYWPSFNGSGATSGDAQQRALLNTYFSLASCVISTVVVSCLLSRERKMRTEHLQNATLAGGVVVGAVADMSLTPGGAVVAGALAGMVSTLGFKYVQPFLLEKLKVHDTCGVHNLHGLPGLLGSLLSILMVRVTSPHMYSYSPAQQAVNQLLAILVTLLFACVGGLVTGLLMRVVGRLSSVTDDEMFSDTANIEDLADKFEVPEEVLGLLEDFRTKSNITDSRTNLLKN